MSRLVYGAKQTKIPRIAQIMKLQCTFDRFQSGRLWYTIYWTEPGTRPDNFSPPNVEEWEFVESDVFEFPVPVEDTGSAEFGPDMSALELMRWIRKHIELLKEARQATSEDDGG